MNEPFTLIYKIRGILMAPPFLFLIFVFIGETEHVGLIWPIGLLVFSTGVSVRIWAQMHLHYRLSIKKVLTITGPYTYIRNPIYVANTSMMLGVTILSEMLWFLPIMLVWCMVLYGFVIRREEAHLLNKYGQPYADFLASTPRWFPRFGIGGGKLLARYEGANFFWASIVAELHCLLWLIPFIGKEMFSNIY